jgi:hypothetical protein
VSPRPGVRRDAAEVPGEALRDRLQGGEAVAALADVAADHLAAVVVGGGKHPAHALLGGEHAGAVGAPHQIRRVGGDRALVACALALARAAREEQAMLAHEATDAPPRGAHARDAQACPDHALPFA